MKPETDRESTLCWWLLERYPTMALCAEDELQITGVCSYYDSAKKVLAVKYLYQNPSETVKKVLIAFQHIF